MIVLNRYMHCLLCAVVLVVIITPVSANIPVKGIMSVFIIENEDFLANGNLNYTINCSIVSSYHPSSYDSFEKGDYSNPWAFYFMLDGTCSSENCSPVTKMTWYHGRNTEEPTFVCELTGSHGNETYTLWNTTGTRRYTLEEFYDIRIVMNGKSEFGSVETLSNR